MNTDEVISLSISRAETFLCPPDMFRETKIRNGLQSQVYHYSDSTTTEDWSDLSEWENFQSQTVSFQIITISLHFFRQ